MTNANETSLRTRAAVAYVVALAAMHAARCDNDSAEVALADARSCYDRDDLRHAYFRACTSLAHSVGIFHAAYTEAVSMRRDELHAQTR
tara:strand:+ start:173 stop:439 length:267 start_codon:yes stop_codon:yes gene_type:complete